MHTASGVGAGVSVEFGPLASAIEINDNPATTTKEERLRDRTIQRSEITGAVACGWRH